MKISAPLRLLVTDCYEFIDFLNLLYRETFFLQKEKHSIHTSTFIYANTTKHIKGPRSITLLVHQVARLLYPIKAIKSGSRPTTCILEALEKTQRSTGKMYMYDGNQFFLPIFNETRSSSKGVI